MKNSFEILGFQLRSIDIPNPMHHVSKITEQQTVTETRTESILNKSSNVL